MVKKWVGIAFVGAMGAGMVANLAYQNVVLGQVSAPVVIEADGVPEPQEEIGVSLFGAANENVTYGNENRYEKNVRFGEAGGGYRAPITVQRFKYTPQSKEMMASELQVAKLLREFQSAEESDKKDIVDQINAEVLKQFELRQAAREKELEELEEQLAKLKEKHQKRESMKDEIISDRVNDLLNNLQGLGWGSEPMPLQAGGYPGASDFGEAPEWLAPAVPSPLFPGGPGVVGGLLPPSMPAVPALPVIPSEPGIDGPAKAEGGEREAKSPRGR